MILMDEDKLTQTDEVERLCFDAEFTAKMVLINAERHPVNFNGRGHDSIHQAIMFLTDALRRLDDANR